MITRIRCGSRKQSSLLSCWMFSLRELHIQLPLCAYTDLRRASPIHIDWSKHSNPIYLLAQYIMWPFSPNRQSGYRPAAVLLAVLCSLEPCNAKIPRSISWSSEGFGPDGPWPAVEVSLDGNTLSLYPGGTWQSQLIPTTYCDGQGSCPAEDAGLIDPERLDEAFIALEGKYNFSEYIFCCCQVSASPYYGTLLPNHA